MNTQKVEFVKSAASPSGFIHDGRPCIAFAGRSNVGKSSVINRLLQRKNMARVGSSPGKTIHVNYFLVDDTVWFVDLPGYGYAKVPAAEKKRWSVLMEKYFADPGEMALGILIVDIRRAPTADDVMMANAFIQAGRHFAVVANKSDKISKSAVNAAVELARSTLNLPEHVPVIPFSAEKGTGREDLLALLEDSVRVHSETDKTSESL